MIRRFHFRTLSRMRFRAQLRQVRTLVQVLAVLQKVNRYGETVWKIGARRIMFICGAGTGGSGVQTVVTIKSSQVMEEMRVESRMDNSIYLRVDAGALLRVLKPAEKATSATIKLGVVGGRPVLQICMAMKSNSSHDVIHDIPVAVLTEEEVGEMTVPDCTGIGSTTPSIFLPPVSELRPFLEKAVKMTDKVQVTANVSSATIELRIQTSCVSSATRFHKLTIGKKDDHDDVPPPTASCIVDAKKLLSIIDLDKLSPTQVLGHFLESRSLIIQHSTHYTTMPIGLGGVTTTAKGKIGFALDNGAATARPISMCCKTTKNYDAFTGSTAYDGGLVHAGMP